MVSASLVALNISRCLPCSVFLFSFILYSKMVPITLSQQHGLFLHCATCSIYSMQNYWYFTWIDYIFPWIACFSLPFLPSCSSFVSFVPDLAVCCAFLALSIVGETLSWIVTFKFPVSSVHVLFSLFTNSSFLQSLLLVRWVVVFPSMWTQLTV